MSDERAQEAAALLGRPVTAGPTLKVVLAWDDCREADPRIEVVEGDGLAVAATPRAGASCQAPAGRARLVELGSMSVPSTYVLRGPATAVPRPAWTIRAGRVTP